MQRSFAVAALAFCTLAGPAASAQDPARDYATIYDDSTVAYWLGRYKPNLEWNFDSLLLARLTPAERTRAAGIRLEVVDRHPGDPLAYEAEGRVVTVSATSIKFLDDIATAAAWLDEHGYQLGTIGYYGDVLKYRPASALTGGRYPTPLEALGIPRDALKNARVDDAAQKILKSAIVFILAHEIGHVVNQDVPSGDAADQARETAADRFALDMFRRIGTPPIGIVFFFQIASHMAVHRGDFGTLAEFQAYLRSDASHPMSGQRLRAFAAALREQPDRFVHAEPPWIRARALRAVRTMPPQVDTLAALFDDEQLQRYARAVGMQIPLAELRPRAMSSPPWIPDVRQ